MLRFCSPAILCIVFFAGEILPDPSQAQTRVQGQSAPIILAQSDDGGGLFRSLFGKRRKVIRGGDIRRKKTPDRRTGSKKRRKKSRTAGSTGNKPAPSAVAKSADAKRVVVIGDFMANALAKGLGEAFASNPDIAVINASNGASGLVRDDFYDWNTRTPKFVAEKQASMIVVMIGGNDRQAIRISGRKIQVNNDAWRAAYDAKVTAFADMLSIQGVPVIWLSLVPVSSGSLSRDYSGFNSLYRQKAELKGISFADVWNGFADDKGRYVSSGPDINGQTRSLRAGDGLNFTRAGRRKLAFFVERDIARILSEGQGPLFAGLGDAATGGIELEKTAVVPVISQMMPIEMISVRAGSRLSKAPGQPELAARADDETPPAGPVPAGRADDFTWPAPQ